jgi:hypothetical protein
MSQDFKDLRGNNNGPLSLVALILGAANDLGTCFLEFLALSALQSYFKTLHVFRNFLASFLLLLEITHLWMLPTLFLVRPVSLAEV